MLLAMSNQGRARTAIPVEVKDYFNGINLWDFFIEKIGREPRTGESVQLTIPKGTRIFGASGGGTAITIDNRWGATSSVRIDNYGEIIGGGGNGGRGAMYLGRETSLGNPYYVLKAQNGGNGGIGVSSTVPVDIRNHNLVSGGGGGGGGSPAWSVGYLSQVPGTDRYNRITIDRFGKYHWFNEVGGGGGGGGAPFGDFHHNLGHFTYILKHHSNNARMVQYANTIMKHLEISCDDLAVRPGERHARQWATSRSRDDIRSFFSIRLRWGQSDYRRECYGTLFDLPVSQAERIALYTSNDRERFNRKYGYDFTVDDAVELLKLCYGLDNYNPTNTQLVDSLTIFYRTHPEYWRTRRLLTDGSSPSSGMIHDDYLDKNRYAFYAYEDEFGATNTPRWSHELRVEYIPTPATDKNTGLGGINTQYLNRTLFITTRNDDDWVNDSADPRFIRPSNSGIDAIRGGNGGKYGENGEDGIINKIEYIYFGNKQDGSTQHGTAKITIPLPLTEQDRNVFIVPGGKGGLAGKVFEGPVHITNHGSGITKGRT